MLVPDIEGHGVITGRAIVLLYGHLATVRVVAEVHGWLPRGSVGIHTQRTPTLLTLPPTGSLHIMRGYFAVCC